MPKPNALIIPVTPFQQNCCLLWQEETKQGAVIDPGGDVDAIVRAIGQSEVAVEQILLTHGHIDHAGGAMELSERLSVPIVGPHNEDLFLLRGLEERAGEYGMSGVRNCTPTTWLEHGEEIRVGDLTFEVRHCPGHTPGHVVFFEPRCRMAIVGDVIFSGSIGRTDFAGGDHAHLLRSIREQILPMGDDVAFLCGHGEPSSVGRERRSNPFLI
jgi:glyoxylase-like metal-dependent hydrolase (beta-lactamase superfamily II)